MGTWDPPHLPEPTPPPPRWDVEALANEWRRSEAFLHEWRLGLVCFGLGAVLAIKAENTHEVNLEDVLSTAGLVKMIAVTVGCVAVYGLVWWGRERRFSQKRRCLMAAYPETERGAVGEELRSLGYDTEWIWLRWYAAPNTANSISLTW